MGKLRDLGLSALAFLLFSGPAAKVIAEDPITPKKPKQKLVQVVKKEEEKETPWIEQVALKLEQHVSSEYDSTVVKSLRVVVVNDGVAHARASIDGVDYAFKEQDTGITAILRTDKRLIVLNNHDKKEGFEDASWMSLDGKNIPWDYTLPQRKDNPAKCKKDYYPDGKERIPPGEAYERELKSVLLIDSARAIMQKFNSTLTGIDFNAYDSIIEDLASANEYRRISLVTFIASYEDLSDLLIKPMPKRFFLNRFIEDIQEIKAKDWPEPLVCEYSAQQGENAEIVFRVDKDEQGESYFLFMSTEKDKNAESIKYVMSPNNEITITKKFSRTPTVEDKSRLVTVVVKYTPKENDGVLEHTNIGLDNAKRLLDLMNPIFQNLRATYDAHQK